MKTIVWSDIAPPGDCLHIATIEIGRTPSPEMHRHDFYECFLVLEGHGHQATPEGLEPLRAGCLYCVCPEHAHCIQGEKNLVFLNLAFEAELFDRVRTVALFEERLWRSNLPIQQVELERRERSQLVETVQEVAHHPTCPNAAWLLLGLARMLARQEKDAQSDSLMPQWFSEGLAHATGVPVLTEGLPALVRIMGRSRKQVGRVFQSQLKATPTEWINRKRIEHACLLLTTTRRSVLEIALDCGFESPSHFHKLFRQQFGTTPLQYRKARSQVQV